MREAYDSAKKHIWQFSASWNDTNVRCGYVEARNMAEAEQEAIKASHPTAKVSVKFSGWNRDA